MPNLRIEDFTKILRVLKNYVTELLISLYAALGIGLFLVIHSLAGDYLAVIGTMAYQFDLGQALVFALLWGLIIFAVLFLTMTVLKQRCIKHVYIIPMLFFCTLGLVALAIIPSALNVWNVIHLFILDCIIGMSYQLYISEHRSQSPSEFSLAAKESKLKALEMEHRELLQHINLILWGTAIALTGLVVAGFVPLITTYKELSQQEALRGLLFTSTVIIIYILVGLWFGILNQLFKKLKTLRIKALEVKEKTT